MERLETEPLYVARRRDDRDYGSTVRTRTSSGINSDADGVSFLHSQSSGVVSGSYAAASAGTSEDEQECRELPLGN